MDGRMDSSGIHALKRIRDFVGQKTLISVNNTIIHLEFFPSLEKLFNFKKESLQHRQNLRDSSNTLCLPKARSNNIKMLMKRQMKFHV